MPAGRQAGWLAGSQAKTEEFSYFKPVAHFSILPNAYCRVELLAALSSNLPDAE